MRGERWPQSMSGGSNIHEEDLLYRMQKLYIIANVPQNCSKFLIKVLAGKKAGWLVLSGGRPGPAPF